MKKITIVISIALFSFFAIASATKFQIKDVAGDIVAWINKTGSLNITEDFICSSCINPEDVNDIDKEDIETDLNTFVDVAGDTMTGNLNMTDKNITSLDNHFHCFGNDCDACVYWNGTNLIISTSC